MAEMPEPEALREHRACPRAIARPRRAAAEDVAQDALLAAMERPPTGNVRGWPGAVAPATEALELPEPPSRATDPSPRAARPWVIG
jgi:hypothetical protein